MGQTSLSHPISRYMSKRLAPMKFRMNLRSVETTETLGINRAGKLLAYLPSMG